MRKMIIAVTVAVLITAVGAWATGTDFSIADKWLTKYANYGGATITHKDMVAAVNTGATATTRGNRFKRLYSESTYRKIGNLGWIREVGDNEYWEVTGTQGFDYTSMLIRIHEPDNFNYGQIKWFADGGSNWSVYVYRWDPGTKKFLMIDDTVGIPNPTLRSISFDNDDDWFNEDGNLFIYMVNWGHVGARDLVCDAIYLYYKE